MNATAKISIPFPLSFRRTEKGSVGFVKKRHSFFFQLEGISELLSSAFDSAKMRKSLKWLSKNAHIAGTPENTALMLKIADEVGLIRSSFS